MGNIADNPSKAGWNKLARLFVRFDHVTSGQICPFGQRFSRPVAGLKRANSPEHESAVADLRRESPWIFSTAATRMGLRPEIPEKADENRDTACQNEN
jgi:hypothetical protein